MEHPNYIAKARRQRGVTQKALADAVGATLSMIGKLERGERELTLTWLDKISSALGCSVEDLIISGDQFVVSGNMGPDGKITISDESANSILSSIKNFSGPGRDSLRSDIRKITLTGGPVVATIPELSSFHFSPGVAVDPKGNGLVLRTLSLLVIEGVGGKVSFVIGCPFPAGEEGRFHVVSIGGTTLNDVIIPWAMPLYSIEMP